MKNVAKPVVIIIFLSLALVAIIFGVQRGIRYFLQAKTKPASTAIPTTAPLSTVAPFPTATATPFPAFAPSPTATLSPISTPSPAYTLQDFQKFLNAMKTNNLDWDLNNDGAVDEADLDIFKTRYLQ